MIYTNQFLETYKQLEVELKFDEKSVLDYENSLSGIEQEKLKVCRIMRNYLAHNDINFLTPSNEQIKFLNELIINIRRQSNLVKDEMKRVRTVSQNELIKNILKLVDRNEYVPMDTIRGIYLIDKSIIIKQLIKGNKKIDIPKRIPKYKFIDKDARIKNLIEDIYIVTEDGTSNGKYLGILNLKKK